MNHYIEFNPYLIREHNQQIHTEVDSLRLQEQLRKNRKARSSSRLFVLVECGRLLVGRVRLAHQHDATIRHPFRRGADSEPQAQIASSKKA